MRSQHLLRRRAAPFSVRPGTPTRSAPSTLSSISAVKLSLYLPSALSCSRQRRRRVRREQRQAGRAARRSGPGAAPECAARAALRPACSRRSAAATPPCADTRRLRAAQRNAAATGDSSELVGLCASGPRSRCGAPPSRRSSASLSISKWPSASTRDQRRRARARPRAHAQACKRWR